ncbi:hypothetical protein CP532_6578 [Ophiocordyceps camponoti-leonardi (nom. inval.)]|nr:hypothetical protein CP532_6578 [Ophiocordyceps camponoti-leonardi (nom. inval.)]
MAALIKDEEAIVVTPQHHQEQEQTPPAPISEDPTIVTTTNNSNRPPSRRSIASVVVVVVPRRLRRGLLGRLAVIPEVKRPYDYSKRTKWGITAVVSLAAVSAPLGSSIFYPALQTLAADLGTSSTVTNLSVAMYMLAMSIFPLWWSSFSELLGRRSIFLVSTALFVLFSLSCAVSSSATMLVIFRVLTGGASASVQTVGAGTISDIWQPHERGTAFGAFYLGPLLGPMVAPIVGGLLSQAFGWRSTMYFLAAYGALLLILLLLLLPETLPSQPPPPPPPEDNADEGTEPPPPAAVGAAVKHLLVDPLRVLLCLRFPAVLLTVLVAAIAFGALFVINVSIQQSFSQSPYGYSQLIIGLLYLPTGLGYFSASLFGGRWIDRIMVRRARKASRYDEKGRLVYLPEDRMGENMWLATVVYPLGILLFGWSVNYGVHWIVPSIGGFFFGMGSMIVFATSTTMLTEFVQKRTSAGVAINNFARNILSCVGTVVAAPWLDAVGPGWVFTAVALFCLGAGLVGMWLLARYARRWRRRMDEVLNNNEGGAAS